MNIIVNGDRQEVPEGTTVSALLERFKLPAVRVAVERNRAIVPKKGYDTTVLQAEDTVEIVTFVGGG